MTLLNKVALVTGAAKRLGAASATALHEAGANVVVHYHQSEEAARDLVANLNTKRENSAVCIGSALGTHEQAQWCVNEATAAWNQLDIVVNNASSFYPTPIGEIDDGVVSDLLASNFLAPLFITQAAQAALNQTNGVVINMADIHGLHPYEEHSVYCAAKAALVMLTRSMAQELAPAIRVNAIAPGAILWPEDGSMSLDTQQQRLFDIPLGRQGSPDDIAQLVVYLCSDKANYITGEIIKVDGGRSV